MAFKYHFRQNAEQWKCALCQSYLSVPPIMAISEDCADHKCGRCSSIQTQMNTWNEFLQLSLKVCRFPCIYDMCDTRVEWGTAKLHEEICPFKTYQCDLLEHCSDIIAIDDLEAHYINKKHNPDSIRCERLYLNVDISEGVFVLIKDRDPYVVYCGRRENKFWVAVFSLKSQPAQYNVKLTPSDGNIIFENQDVITYNQRRHCAQCMFRNCSLRHHVFSTVNEGNAAMGTDFCKNVAEARGSNKVTCTVYIIDKPGPSRANIPKLFLKPSSIINNKFINDILKCCYCRKIMYTDIYCCDQGHVICEDCRRWLEMKCPTCENIITPHRSYALEQIATGEFSCEFKDCPFKNNLINYVHHLKFVHNRY